MSSAINDMDIMHDPPVDLFTNGCYLSRCRLRRNEEETAAIGPLLRPFLTNLTVARLPAARWIELRPNGSADPALPHADAA